LSELLCVFEVVLHPANQKNPQLFKVIHQSQNASVQVSVGYKKRHGLSKG
jgi:hypothetical protein